MPGRGSACCPEDKPLDDMLVVYERPCVITDDTVGWLNRNGWETMREVYDWFDIPADDTPPPPSPEPLRIQDTTSGLRPGSSATPARCSP